jgi:hypothetical protein
MQVFDHLYRLIVDDKIVAISGHFNFFVIVATTTVWIPVHVSCRTLENGTVCLYILGAVVYRKFWQAENFGYPNFRRRSGRRMPAIFR